MPKLVLALSLPFLVALSYPRAASWAYEPVQADTATVTFKSKAAAVGDKHSSSEDMLMTMAVRVSGKSMTIDSSETEERKTEVLAVADGVATKVRVRYLKHQKESKVDGKSSSATSPVGGKTYIVERKGDKVVVTNADGKSVSPEEEKQLIKNYRRLGKPDEITKTLKSKPRKVGEKLDDVAKAMSDQFRERSDASEKVTIEETKLVFSEVKKIDGIEHAVLDLTVKMVAEPGADGKLTMDLKGKVLVRIDEASYGEITMAGPIKMTGRTDATGSLTLKTKTGP
jgi:hypothetical protein